MQYISIPSFFFVYSGLSLLAACLIGVLFWGKKDRSAHYWILSCTISAVAAFTTVFRAEIPIVVSYSAMVSLELFSILLTRQSLEALDPKPFNRRWSKTCCWVLPVLLFLSAEGLRWSANGALIPAMTLVTAIFFGLGNVASGLKAYGVGKNYEHPVFFSMMSGTMWIMGGLYFMRALNILVEEHLLTFDHSTLNVLIWIPLILLGAVRNLMYIALRMHMGFAERSHLSVMNLRLTNVLDERNRFIMQIEKFNRLFSASSISSQLVHEIRQPLTSLRLNLENLLAPWPTPKDKQEKTDDLPGQLSSRLLSDVDRISGIVNSIDRYVRAPVSETHQTLLGQVFTDVSEIAATRLRETGVTLTTICDADCFVAADRVHLQQVFINLINNAIEALNQKPRDKREISFIALKMQTRVRIYVEDNGPGFSPEAQETLFDPMATQKTSGAGIGLWLCRDIITRYGGSMTAENRPEGGARLIIFIPTVREGLSRGS